MKKLKKNPNLQTEDILCLKSFLQEKRRNKNKWWKQDIGSVFSEGARRIGDEGK